jgi:hypothetical protein
LERLPQDRSCDGVQLSCPVLGELVQLSRDHLRQHLAQKPLQLEQVATDRVEYIQHHIHEASQDPLSQDG